MLLALRANLLLQMALKIGGDAVIIEQRVVNVEEENDLGHGDGENLYQGYRLNQKLWAAERQPIGCLH